MNYKAIIFDLDGTVIPNRQDGVPSQHLIDLIEKIKNNVFVCAATGRPISNCRHILKALKLISPCIISGGTQIINPVSEEILWERMIPEDLVRKIIDIAKPFDYQVYISNETVSSLASEKIITGPEHIIYIMTVNQHDTDILLTQLGAIANITAHPVPSWTKDHFDVHITHIDATKKHSLELLLEMLHVKKGEVIGFGDGNNDLPIFEAVGYKVAMANGSQALKDAADFIAPSADDDGVATTLDDLLK